MSAGAGSEFVLFMLDEGSIGLSCAVGGEGLEEGGVGVAAARMLAIEGTWEGGGISDSRRACCLSRHWQRWGRHWQSGAQTHRRTDILG